VTSPGDTLVRLGIDEGALRAGTLSAAELAPRLAGTEGVALVAALGDVATPSVAALLVAVEPAVGDRAVRKEIRRTLYRLRQRGIPTPTTEPAPARPVAADLEGLLSGFDARGDRIAWIVRPAPSGTTLTIAATLNEPAGLRDVHVAETSRKQLRTVRRRMEVEAAIRLVAADWRIVDALLVEAHERAGGGASERDYLRIRPRLTSDPPAPASEPVSRRVAAPTDDELPALLAASAALVEEPELRGWYPTQEAAAPFVARIAEIRASPLLVSRAAQEERVREVVANAASTLFPPPVLQRRLEGTAYVLAETGRVEPARRALAAARALGQRPAAALEVPLVAALVERTVGALLAQTTARQEQERSGSLVVTPGEYLRDRAGRTRG
jgi:hypothetical protein